VAETAGVGSQIQFSNLIPIFFYFQAVWFHFIRQIRLEHLARHYQQARKVVSTRRGLIATEWLSGQNTRLPLNIQRFWGLARLRQL
jgi:hypothetical protein